MTTTTAIIDRATARLDAAREDLGRTQDVAAFADVLKSVHNELLAGRARQLLADAFPDHDLAVFTRSWDEDAPRLYQLLSQKDGVADYDADEDQFRPGWMSTDQWQALIEAERLVTYMGTDEEIHEHLDPGEAEHEDWTEYRLALHG